MRQYISESEGIVVPPIVSLFGKTVVFRMLTEETGPKRVLILTDGLSLLRRKLSSAKLEMLHLLLGTYFLHPPEPA